MERADGTIMYSHREEIRTIIAEGKLLEQQAPYFGGLLNKINALAKDGYEAIETWIDEQISHINYQELSDTKNGYASCYELRTQGHMITNKFFKETLLDKFHTLISLYYYKLFNFPRDYKERIVTPVSACEEPWLLDER